MRRGSLEGLARIQIEAALTRITEPHYRAELAKEQKVAIEDLGRTYLAFDRLRRDKRDTIWAYVARNLSRPLAYSAAGGRAHVVIGNPPWLPFRHMSADLQRRFRALARDERVYVGGRFRRKTIFRVCSPCASPISICDPVAALHLSYQWQR
jgi:hypothetical protein